MSLLAKLSILLAGIAAFAAVWAIGDVLYTLFKRWQSRYVEETAVQFDEMLLQLPAHRLVNYSFMGAFTSALLVFAVISSLGEGWNWTGGLIFAAVAFVSVVLGMRLAVRLLRKRRLQRFNDQLEEALMSMSNSLRAGFSITQAIELVIRQKRQPLSVEFKLMLQQTQLGMTFDDALQNMANRVGSEDFRLVATAISTARVTGGDLTGIFDRLAHLIRERLRIQRRITSLSAQGRLQGWVLGALPLLMLFAMSLLDPQLIRDFVSQPKGILLLLTVLVLEICGFWTINKIVTIEI